MIVTRAGRLRKKTSQGWPSSSASRTRPIRMPRATPRLMAMTKLAATRSSVIARLKGSSPVAESAAILASTAAGGGIRRGLPAAMAADLPQGQQRQQRQGRDQHAAQRAGTGARRGRGGAGLRLTARLRAMGLSSSPSARTCRGPAPCPCPPASRRRARPAPRTAWRPRPAARRPNARRCPRGSGA